MRLALSALLVLVVLVPSSHADEDSENPVPTLRMIHLRDGFRSVAPKRNMGLFASTDIFRTAKAAGVDLGRPDHDLLIQSYKANRLFYVFYKTVDGALGDRPYLIQRIKKTVREWKTADSEPEETVTYQVEVFKLQAGSLKRADQHFGSFGLRDLYKREVHKEYELGFGEIPGLCEGLDWPFSSKRLYELLQPYGKAVGFYDEVVFSAQKDWTLTVTFARDGTYSVRSPELGFDAPKTMPDRKRFAHVRDPRTASWILKAGDGVDALYVGESPADEIAGVLGSPLEVRRFKVGSENHVTPAGLTVNVDKTGVVNTIFTRPEFAGKTARGIGLGSTRADVMAAYGVPERQQTDAPYWAYKDLGILFYFDGWHEVERIVVSRIPE